MTLKKLVCYTIQFCLNLSFSVKWHGSGKKIVRIGIESVVRIEISVLLGFFSFK